MQQQIQVHGPHWKLTKTKSSIQWRRAYKERLASRATGDTQSCIALHILHNPLRCIWKIICYRKSQVREHTVPCTIKRIRCARIVHFIPEACSHALGWHLSQNICHQISNWACSFQERLFLYMRALTWVTDHLLISKFLSAFPQMTQSTKGRLATSAYTVYGTHRRAGAKEGGVDAQRLSRRLGATVRKFASKLEHWGSNAP